MFDKYNEYTGKGIPFRNLRSDVVNWYDVRRLNQPYSRTRMKAFFNNDTIKSLLHVPQHLDFSTNDPIVFHFLKVKIHLQG